MGNGDDPYTRAKRLEDQGRFDLAESEYQHAIRLEVGDQAIAHQGRDRALARLGRLDEAIDECQTALALNPDLRLAHGVLGYVFGRQTKYDSAEEELLAALRLQPDDIVSLRNLVLQRDFMWYNSPQ